MSAIYDGIKKMADDTTGPALSYLQNARTNLESIALNPAQFDLLAWMAPINYLPSAWRVLVVSIFSGMLILITFYSGLAVYNLYLKLKEGIFQWL